MNEPIPNALAKQGITDIQDNIGPDQELACGHLLFQHFEKEFRAQFIDNDREEGK